MFISSNKMAPLVLLISQELYIYIPCFCLKNIHISLTENKYIIFKFITSCFHDFMLVWKCFKFRISNISCGVIAVRADLM